MNYRLHVPSLSAQIPGCTSRRNAFGFRNNDPAKVPCTNVFVEKSSARIRANLPVQDNFTNSLLLDRKGIRGNNYQSPEKSC